MWIESEIGILGKIKRCWTACCHCRVDICHVNHRIIVNQQWGRAKMHNGVVPPTRGTQIKKWVSIVYCWSVLHNNGWQIKVKRQTTVGAALDWSFISHDLHPGKITYPNTWLVKSQHINLPGSSDADHVVSKTKWRGILNIHTWWALQPSKCRKARSSRICYPLNLAKVIIKPELWTGAQRKQTYEGYSTDSSGVCYSHRGGMIHGGDFSRSEKSIVLQMYDRRRSVQRYVRKNQVRFSEESPLNVKQKMQIAHGARDPKLRFVGKCWIRNWDSHLSFFQRDCTFAHRIQV